MKITILGTRGLIKPFSEKHKFHTGILVDDILFDVGERHYLEYNSKAIFITHLHPDHAFFVDTKDSVHINCPVYVPETTKKLPEAKIIKNIVKINNYEITPIETHHSNKLESVAYIIRSEKNKVLITGDIVWIDKEHHDKFANLDLVITEGSYINKGGRIIKNKKTGRIYGHTGIPDLIRLFKPYTKKIVFSHFGSWFYHDEQKSIEKILALCKENHIEGIVAEDGLDIKLN